MGVQAILLDIGGVVVKLSGMDRLSELIGGEITPEELSDRWSRSRYVQLYETGQCGKDEFAKGIVDELKMDIAPQAFIEEFVLFTSLFPKADELLMSLRLKYILACLSNTNEAQWEGLCDRFSIDSYFEYALLSYKIGIMKPDPRIYVHAIHALNLRPEEIAFFDDSQINVDAARRAGMLAHKVVGLDDLRRKLGENLWYN